tara:strand:- start:278 stop:475 length:198 start_codon:yes stop_codon:yes gene_type:complete
MVSGSIKMYSFLVVLNFPTVEACNEAHQIIHGDMEGSCFITYKDVLDKAPIPPSRPQILEIKEEK